LISEEFIRRLAIRLEAGAKRYGPDNWRKGMPFCRTADSLIRHIFQWLDRDSTEDHLAAIACNAMFLMHYEQAHRNLDDRCPPRFETPNRKGTYWNGSGEKKPLDDLDLPA
jgi:hypothetical protein